jgi:hypothetical protein
MHESTFERLQRQEHVVNNRGALVALQQLEAMDKRSKQKRMGKQSKGNVGFSKRI